MDSRENYTFINSSSSEQLTDNLAIHTRTNVWKTILAVQLLLAIIGIAGNTVNLLVFSRPAFSHLSPCVYLRFLAFVDITLQFVYTTCSMITVLVENPNPETVADGRLHPIGQWICVSLAILSAWIIMALSIERVIAILFPLRVKELCTKQRAVFVCTSLIPCIFLMNIHVLILERNPYSYFPLPGYFTLMYSSLPSLIITTCNAILIWGICQRPVLGHYVMEHRGVTIMMVVNSVGFVALTAPYSIFLLMTHYFEDPVQFVRVLRILASLCALNHCINFLFYGISGSLFRKELRQMLSCFCKPENQLKGKRQGTEEPLRLDQSREKVETKSTQITLSTEEEENNTRI